MGAQVNYAMVQLTIEINNNLTISLPQPLINMTEIETEELTTMNSNL